MSGGAGASQRARERTGPPRSGARGEAGEAGEAGEDIEGIEGIEAAEAGRPVDRAPCSS